jgi:hypothetical protein
VGLGQWSFARLLRTLDRLFNLSVVNIDPVSGVILPSGNVLYNTHSCCKNGAAVNQHPPTRQFDAH